MYGFPLVLVLALVIVFAPVLVPVSALALVLVLVLVPVPVLVLVLVLVLVGTEVVAGRVAVGVTGHGSGAVILPAAKLPAAMTSAASTKSGPRYGLRLGVNASSSTPTAAAGRTDLAGGRTDFAGGLMDFGFGPTRIPGSGGSSFFGSSFFGSSRTIGGGRTDAMSMSRSSSSRAEGGGSEIVIGTSMGSGGGGAGAGAFGDSSTFALAFACGACGVPFVFFATTTFGTESTFGLGSGTTFFAITAGSGAAAAGLRVGVGAGAAAIFATSFSFLTAFGSAIGSGFGSGFGASTFTGSGAFSIAVSVRTLASLELAALITGGGAIFGGSTFGGDSSAAGACETGGGVIESEMPTLGSSFASRASINCPNVFATYCDTTARDGTLVAAAIACASSFVVEKRAVGSCAVARSMTGASAASELAQYFNSMPAAYTSVRGVRSPRTYSGAMNARRFSPSDSIGMRPRLNRVMRVTPSTPRNTSSGPIDAAHVLSAVERGERREPFAHVGDDAQQDVHGRFARGRERRLEALTVDPLRQHRDIAFEPNAPDERRDVRVIEADERLGVLFEHDEIRLADRRWVALDDHELGLVLPTHRVCREASRLARSELLDDRDFGRSHYSKARAD